MFQDSRINKVLYGGDYNPEQWPEEIWEEDMRLFKLAGIDEVTFRIFIRCLPALANSICVIISHFFTV